MDSTLNLIRRMLMHNHTPHHTPLGNGSHKRILVELDGIEPTTPCLQSRCSPN